MSLYQNSVLKKYLRAQDPSTVDQAWQRYTDHFFNPQYQHNVRAAKEEQYQEGFLRDLFVQILGYTLHPEPDYDLTTELKNIRGAKKTDGAILQDGKAIAVIELKGTDTVSLDKIEDQAFGYKRNQPNCSYVITSNFEKLRFYIEDSIDYIDFPLFQLTRDEFDLLYLCLSRDSIFADLPKRIKTESVNEDEAITKKLYRDYSAFRREIFDSIVQRNPEHDRLTLFKSTQKLLDRFLFIFFAEDRGLLPPNAIGDIIKKWVQLRDELDAYAPLYERFKKYFGYLYTGHRDAKHEIFAYNGGLFAPDELLDSILIDDDILYAHTQRLSDYDFESEVSVNILGHIFEHSLNEIEEIQADIDGQTLDRAKTKRKKDGVFYTPKYITKYIVDHTVGQLCADQRAALDIDEAEYEKDRKGRTKKKLAELQEKLESYRSWLLTLTICDPACGSGAFLNQALEYLIAEHSYIDTLQTKLLGGGFTFPNVENAILEHNLYGVDINQESVEIAKLSLWLRTAQRGRKLSSLNDNIKCGNSLIDDPEVAGDKAFSWEEEFPDVFDKGGFDVVIGNPPYVRAEYLGDIKLYLESKYKVYHSASDLFAYFYEKGIHIIKPEKGTLSYISNTFDKTTAGEVLRLYLQTEVSLDEYVDLTEVKVFDGATTYPVIITISDVRPSKSHLFDYKKIKKDSIISIELNTVKPINVMQSRLEASTWAFLSVEMNDLLDKIKEHKSVRSLFGKCYRGLITGLNEAFIVPVGAFKSTHIKNIYEGKEIMKWLSPVPEQSLILFESKWTNETFPELTEEEHLDNLRSRFPDIMEHLLQFQEKAIKRYDKGEYWWELRNCAYYDLFEQPKIIFPNLQNQNKFCFDDQGVYINAPAVFLPTDNKTLLCILNSNMVWAFLRSICVVRSGGYIEVKPQYFEQIPIPDLSNVDFSESADHIISLTSQSHKIVASFIKLLQSKYPIEKLSKKLQSWYDLDFGEFLAELKKKKVKLSLQEQAEWMPYFEEQRAAVQEIRTQIDRIDAEIDQMVYQLYGLTEEEIAIVEEAVG